eukprot:1158564-Pelagomonas_calceolata.AAC.1
MPAGPPAFAMKAQEPMAGHLCHCRMLVQGGKLNERVLTAGQAPLPDHGAIRFSLLEHSTLLSTQATLNSSFIPKFDMLIQRFTDNGGGAAYSLGNRISTLSSYLTDFGRMGDLEVLAKKYDGALVDASDFLDGARAHVQANQMFMTSTAPTLCMWLQEHNDIKR